MTPKRLGIFLMISIVLLFAGLIGGAYKINALLVSEANKLTALKAKSLALSQENTSLQKAKQDIKKYDYLNKIAKSVVPEDKDQAQAVREIVNIASKNGISLTTINFPASTLGTLAPGVTNPSSSASATTKTVAPPNTKTTALSQLVPVKSIPGIYQLPITVIGDSNNSVRYDEFINFLTALENNRRTAQVSAITLAPDSKDHSRLTFTLTVNEYIKP